MLWCIYALNTVSSRSRTFAQGIPLNATNKKLRREVHQVSKKLKKTKKELRKSKKNYAKATIEINHLHQSSKQFFQEYMAKKNHLNEELEGTRKRASEKSWFLMANIFSLEAKLREVKEQIDQLDRGLAWV